MGKPQDDRGSYCVCPYMYTFTIQSYVPPGVKPYDARVWCEWMCECVSVTVCVSKKSRMSVAGCYLNTATSSPLCDYTSTTRDCLWLRVEKNVVVYELDCCFSPSRVVSQRYSALSTSVQPSAVSALAPQYNQVQSVRSSPQYTPSGCEINRTE